MLSELGILKWKKIVLVLEEQNLKKRIQAISIENGSLRVIKLPRKDQK